MILLHDALRAAGLEAERITADQKRYTGGLSVIPGYLTKGLKFDCVLVADAHMHMGAASEPEPWEIKRIPVGRWPGGVVFRPDGALAYVANNKTNDISVIEGDGSILEVGVRRWCSKGPRQTSGVKTSSSPSLS